MPMPVALKQHEGMCTGQNNKTVGLYPQQPAYLQLPHWMAHQTAIHTDVQATLGILDFDTKQIVIFYYNRYTFINHNETSIKISIIKWPVP